MFLAINKDQATKYLIERKAKTIKRYGEESVKYVEPNLNRKYPVFIRESGVDMRGVRGNVDVWVEFYPVTKDIIAKVKNL